MRLRGLTLVLGAADLARFRTALSLAAAQAALGGGCRLFMDGPAVALLKPNVGGSAALPPEVADLLDTALDLGVGLIVCQSGLASAGLDATTLDPRVVAGGMVSVLQALGEDRLVLA